MSSKEKYWQRKEKGLCTDCEAPVIYGKTYCDNCTERRNSQRRANAAYYKKIGICTRCGKNKAFGKFSTCEFCLEKRAINRRPRENSKEYQKKRREMRKSLGLCALCPKPAVEGKTMCQSCLNRLRIYGIAYRKAHSTGEEINAKHKDWKKKGLCYMCGNPVIEGKKTCERCYANNLANLKKGLANNPWHKYKCHDLFVDSK